MNEWKNSSNVVRYEQLFFLKEKFPRMVLASRAWNGSVTSVNIRIILNVTLKLIWLPWRLSGKESACNAGDSSLIPGSRRSLGEGNGTPLQYYSCLGIPHGQRSLVGYSPLRSQRVWHDWAHIQRWSHEHCGSHHVLHHSGDTQKIDSLQRGFYIFTCPCFLNPSKGTKSDWNQKHQGSGLCI